MILDRPKATGLRPWGLSPWGLLEQPVVKRQRQQIAHLVLAADRREIREDHADVAAVFPQQLTTRPARRRGRGGVGDDGDGRELALAFGERLEQRDALSADGE